MSRLTYPTGMLTNLARSFAPKHNSADQIRLAVALRQMEAADGQKEAAQARAAHDNAKAGEVSARMQARSPESLGAAVLSGMGMSPAARDAQDVGEFYRTGRNPVTPGQAAVELPQFGGMADYSTQGLPNLADALGSNGMNLATLAPAIPAQERVVDPAQARQYAQGMGDFLAMMAATGDTNYDQFQQGRTGRMKNDMLDGAMRGQEFAPQALALAGARDLFNGQGINSFDGTGGQAFEADQVRRLQEQQIQSGDRRYGTDVGASTSRRGQDITAGTSLANNRLDNQTKVQTAGMGGDGAKAAAEEQAAIRDIDIKLKPIRQAPLSDPEYTQFARTYNKARELGDFRALREILYRAIKAGLIVQEK